MRRASATLTLLVTAAACLAAAPGASAGDVTVQDSLNGTARVLGSSGADRLRSTRYADEPGVWYLRNDSGAVTVTAGPCEQDGWNVARCPVHPRYAHNIELRGGDDRWTSQSPDHVSVFGEEGDDTILLGPGNDAAVTGPGDDFVLPGLGADLVNAGAADDATTGYDVVSYVGHPAGVFVDPGDGWRSRVDGMEGERDAVTAVDEIIGTDHADRLLGRAGDDVLIGLGGNDVLSSGTGDDRLVGGAGDDRLLGGDGRDLASYHGHSARVTAGIGLPDWGSAGERDQAEGIESLEGGAGPDVLSGHDGPNILAGGPGADVLTARGGTDVVRGGAGDDRLLGGFDADQLDGGDGTDELRGEHGSDTLLGREGADRLLGGDAPDWLRGGSGEDRLHGGGGNDVLAGEDGDDVLLADAGADALVGGPGKADVADYGARGTALVVDLSEADGDGARGENDDVQAERVRGGSGADRLTGDAGPNVLWGGAGNDVLLPLGGVDAAHGEDGDDILRTGDGVGDHVTCGKGEDVLDTFDVEASVGPDCE